MNTSPEKKQNANDLRKAGDFSKAIPLYKKQWQDACDAYDGAGLLHCLRKLQRFDEAIPFADEKFILSKLQEKGKKLDLIQMPKAEQNIAVAAASILARARFLEKLRKLSADIGIELPKGASPRVIEAAKKIVARHGKVALQKVAKLHFKTTKQVLGN